MPALASAFFSASAAIALLLGSLHLLYTYRGKKLHPRDAALAKRMQEVSPIISRQTTIWRAGVGFHASHSLGAIFFGVLYLYLALVASHFLFGSKFLLGLGFVYLAAMVVLAKLYWFSIPFRGIALATSLYAAGIIAALA
jgi:hypothetical protein